MPLSLLSGHMDRKKVVKEELRWTPCLPALLISQLCTAFIAGSLAHSPSPSGQEPPLSREDAQGIWATSSHPEKASFPKKYQLAPWRQQAAILIETDTRNLGT